MRSARKQVLLLLLSNLSPTAALLLSVVRGERSEAPAAEGQAQAPWRPAGPGLPTTWTARVDPSSVWQEYPRPTLARGPDSWRNLNGLWNFAVARAPEAEGWPAQRPPAGLGELPFVRRSGEILVPFSIESSLSGVGHWLRRSQELWYERHFKPPETHKPGNRVFLNFEAVDYDCVAIVNGKDVGHHRGGSTPFQFDITSALGPGSESNHLLVKVVDKTSGYQLVGKESSVPYGIFYNRSSGIRGTVWVETVPQTFIKSVHVNGVLDASTAETFIEMTGVLDGKDSDLRSVVLRVKVFDGESQVGPSSYCKPAVRCRVPVPGAKLWSPGSPFLYGVKVAVVPKDGIEARQGVADQVSSYAGIRSIGKKRDHQGHLRITLNGDFLFNWGVLDQGWWPDGGLTAPSVEAMRSDIDYLKAAGFNVIRKHMKVEPRLFYEHCDRVGMLVWQDHVAAPGCATYHRPCAEGVSPKTWSRLAREEMLRRVEDEEAQWPMEDHRQFMAELGEMVASLQSHPSIVAWVPFNEAWGQHRTVEVGQALRTLDPSRLIDLASGGNFFPFGDMADEHNYPNASFPTDDTRYEDYVKVVGEFGGLGLPVKGHVIRSVHDWDSDWGYKSEEDAGKLLSQFKDELLNLAGLIGQGVAGAVYTQTTDVEHETNGLLTYDRRVQKLRPDDLRKAAAIVFDASAKAVE